MIVSVISYNTWYYIDKINNSINDTINIISRNSYLRMSVFLLLVPDDW